MKLPPTVLGISRGDLLPEDVAGFLAGAERALRGGLRGILLRERRLDDGPYLALARELRTRLDAVGGWLGVHDRLHLAPAARADGLHVGFRSLEPGDVGRVLRADRALGLSTHAGDRLDALHAVDYVFHGPVRATPSKADWLEPIGVDGLASACRASTCPVWALGGLRPADVPAALAAGARGVAVLGGILAAEDTEAAARAYAAALPAASTG